MQIALVGVAGRVAQRAPAGGRAPAARKRGKKEEKSTCAKRRGEKRKKTQAAMREARLALSVSATRVKARAVREAALAEQARSEMGEPVDYKQRRKRENAPVWQPHVGTVARAARSIEDSTCGFGRGWFLSLLRGLPGS